MNSEESSFKKLFYHKYPMLQAWGILKRPLFIMNKRFERNIFFVIVLAAGLSFLFIYLLELGFFSTDTGKFRNGQPYRTYREGGVVVRYPAWKDIEGGRLIEPDKIKLAVANDNCAFVINSEKILDPEKLPDMYEEYRQKRIEALGSKIIESGRDETGFFLTEELKGDVYDYTSFTRFYVSKDNNFYKIYVIGEKGKFAGLCAPVIEESFKNIKAY